MEHVTSSTGATISYDRYGSGPPLVLVHGALSDHDTNWEAARPLLSTRFSVCAVARRGRGETDATEGHTFDAECADIAAVIQQTGEPVFLLGHSYGAHVALGAAALTPSSIRKLILYEPPWPHALSQEALAHLEELAQAGDWDGSATFFLGDVVLVPQEELEELRASEIWPPIVGDAKATLGDIRALSKYGFEAARFRDLRLPVLLLRGTESPSELYTTDALADALPNVRISELSGQAHEGMSTAPEMFVEAISAFLLKR